MHPTQRISTLPSRPRTSSDGKRKRGGRTKRTSTTELLLQLLRGGQLRRRALGLDAREHIRLELRARAHAPDVQPAPKVSISVYRYFIQG